MEREDDEVLYRFQEGGGRPQVIGSKTGSVSVQADVSLSPVSLVFCLLVVDRQHGSAGSTALDLLLSELMAYHCWELDSTCSYMCSAWPTD